MHFLKINFGTQWTCSSGQSMIIIMTYPTLAKHYSKSQFMKYDNIIHIHGSKKSPDLEQFKYQARGGGQKRAKLCLHSFSSIEPRTLFPERIGTRNSWEIPKIPIPKAQIWFKFCLVERKCTKAKHLFMLLLLHHVFEKYILFCFFFPPAVASTLLVWMQI